MTHEEEQEVLAAAATALVKRAERIEQLARTMDKRMHDSALARLHFWKEAAEALVAEGFFLVSDGGDPK